MAGKGSRQRPTDMDAYRENYDRIFGKPKCALTTNRTETDRHYEEAGSVGEEMRLHQDKMQLPHYLIEQAE